MSRNPPATIDDAYLAFIQEERSQGIAKSKHMTDDVHAFALRADRGRSVTDRNHIRHDKSTLFYSHCRRSRHEKATCFKIHGYPNWWEDRNRSRVVGTGRGVATGASGSTSSLPSHGRGGVRAHALLDVPGFVERPQGAGGQRCRISNPSKSRFC